MSKFDLARTEKFELIKSVRNTNKSNKFPLIPKRQFRNDYVMKFDAKTENES